MKYLILCLFLVAIVFSCKKEHKKIVDVSSTSVNFNIKRFDVDFYTTPMTPLEAAEKIEAIRYLEVGKKIKMIETSVESIGIDTPEDLEKAKKLF